MTDTFTTFRVPTPAELGLTWDHDRINGWFADKHGRRCIARNNTSLEPWEVMIAGEEYDVDCGVETFEDALVVYALYIGRRDLLYVPTWAELGAGPRLPMHSGTGSGIGWAHEQEPDADGDRPIQYFGYVFTDEARVTDHWGEWWISLGPPGTEPSPSTYFPAGHSDVEARSFIARLRSWPQP